MTDKRTLSNGFTRDNNQGKLRYDLIPLELLDELALLYMKGAEVHGENNWMLADNDKDFIESAWRHFRELIGGDDSARAPLIFNINGIVNARKNAKNKLAQE